MRSSLTTITLALIAFAGATAAGAQAGNSGYIAASDGVRLFYRVVGTGRDTIVMLHGGAGFTMDYLVPDFAPLAAKHTLIFYDQRGSGRSVASHDTAHISADKHVADLEALRKHFAIDRLTILGHSWGGMLAALYAGAYPAHVARLVLENPGPSTDDPRFGRNITAWADSAMRARISRLDRDSRDTSLDRVATCRAYFTTLLRGYWSNPADTIGLRSFHGDVCSYPHAVDDINAVGALTDRSLRGRNALAGLDAVHAPTLIITGRQDPIPWEDSESWWRAIANAQLTIVEHAGHFTHVERPDEFFPAVEAFLSGAPTASPPSNVTATEQMSGTHSLLIGISVVNDQVVWASGTNGTFVHTTDGGVTWHSGVVAGAEHLEFRDVYGIDERSAYLLSAGPADSSRIYVTHDAGATWTNEFTNVIPKGFLDCMDFWDARRGIAVGDAVDTHTFILQTTDGGAHWARIAPERTPVALEEEGSFAASGTCVVAARGGLAWIVTGTPKSRLLRTTDYGSHWKVDTVPIGSISSVTFANSAYGVVFGGDSTAGAAATYDGGKTWHRGGPPPFAQGLYGGTFVPGTARPMIVAGGPAGLAWSNDDGVTWTTINRNNYWSVAFASPTAGWAVGRDGRITKLTTVAK